MEHFRFNMRDQRSDESFTEWLADLRAIAKTCSFNSIQKVEDALLCNRIIHGIRDKKAQAKMLDCRGPDLETVIDIARTCEATEHHLKTISQTSDVHAVNSDKSYKKNKLFTKRKPTTQSDNVKRCLFCMKEHVMRKESCPAWGKTCNTCKKTGHFKGSKMCKSGGKKHVHALYDESETDSSDTEELCGVESINNVQNTGKAVYCTMLVGEKCNESEVKFQIDCGATVNVLPLKHLTVNEKDKISNSQITLKMWNGSTINAVGKLAVRVRNPKSGGKYRAPFVIVDSDLTPLLSRKTAEQMGLITINYESFEHVHSLVTEHDQPFSAYPSTISDGLGDLPGLVKLVTDDAQPPEIKPARRVAVALKPAVKKKLSDLEKLDVLAKVDEPTDWVSQMAVSTKRSGDLRICIDPQVLNKSLKREHFQLPVLEDVLPDLAKAKIFSKLDLANGYWHCKLDEESSLKTTFSTPFGRYRWKRLPFGLTVGSEIFQKRLMTALDGLDGVLCVADDIIVWGSGYTQTDAIADHDVKLKNLLERCSKLNIKLNHSKCEIRKTEIAFLGHLVTNRGLLPDPEKIKAVLDLDKPASVESIQQLNGFVNYLSKFMPHRRSWSLSGDWLGKMSHGDGLRNKTKPLTASKLLPRKLQFWRTMILLKPQSCSATPVRRALVQFCCKKATLWRTPAEHSLTLSKGTLRLKRRLCRWFLVSPSSTSTHSVVKLLFSMTISPSRLSWKSHCIVLQNVSRACSWEFWSTTQRLGGNQARMFR